ncbi:molybdate ABC transporter permease subunit [Peptoniphilus sp. AGMB00490]|uniref:Molybdate ABC transporter permease subunit n=2 Tax=Peptoniphilus TaxID=162289 RepID=A0ACD6AZ81_9FIRM|nr:MULTISPECIES: molybdate ABC transporter permease subunit [Peptoniphilus]NMW85606.1 molybdate ABC transporter permease subunit [Peptoniphilus faecalis]OLR64586.1 molybdenum ABC transporter permease subunit [Peptoniphilus porci]
MSPLLVSLLTALLASIINFFLGIGLAYLVMNMKKGRSLVDGFLTLSMVLPPTVVGFFLLIIFGKNSIIGKFLKSLGISIIFTPTAAVISAIVVSLPIMYRTSLGAFEQVSEDILFAAKTLGISKMKIFWKILLPLSVPGVFSGLILTFARALGEFGATIMIAGNIPGKTQTMSTAIYSAVQAGNRLLAFKWSITIIVISFSSMILANILSQKLFREN